MNRVSILGIDIDNVSMEDALARISRTVENGEFAYAVTPNVDHIMRLRNDGPFLEVYRAADLVVADGVPLLWASRILRSPLKERVNGTDLFERTCELASRRGYSVYLLGGNPGVAAKACARLKEKLAGLKIAGWFCPELGFDEDPARNREIQELIRNTGADILFVALGAPKQEKWIHRYARQSGAKFAVGIGISFSLIAGDIKRAPVWIQNHGLEWSWRLLSEPRRLWKRYLVDDIPFIRLILLEWLRMRSRAVVRPITTPSTAPGIGKAGT